MPEEKFKRSNFREFKINKSLEKLSQKIAKISKIEIIGIDFLKKDGKWLVLEVNAQPGLDFFKKKKENL